MNLWEEMAETALAGAQHALRAAREARGREDLPGVDAALTEALSAIDHARASVRIAREEAGVAEDPPAGGRHVLGRSWV